MQKVLRKRIVRDLKENFVRYLALGAMIVLCMYIIISLIGTADTIIIGSEKTAVRNQLEDGQFTLFMPLTNVEKDKLCESGITLEEQFYLDYKMEDESTVRVFKNRKQINLVELVEGREIESDYEIVLERRYADEHALQPGNVIKIGGKEYEVVGIGCSPDYEAPYKDFSDSSVNGLQFGTAFVTVEAYEELLKEGKSVKAEEYVYAYQLNGKLTHKELKDILNDVKADAEEIEDDYFQEYWKEQTEDKNELEEGIEKLKDGSTELYDALNDLADIQTGIAPFDEGIANVKDGAGELADGIEELQNETDKFLEEHFDLEISNLTLFLEAEDNPRIGAAAEDQMINKYGGIIAGAIVLVLFAYVISVFVVYGIEKENSTIGALYALGVKRNELILHYLCLPVAVTLIAGVIGSLIGFGSIGESTITGNCYAYFSIPQMETIYEEYLLVYGEVLPPVLSTVVNFLVIRKKLNKPALQMLRNEQKNGNMSQIKLGKMGFIATFRIRQMLREARTSLTVVGGMFISLLILMLGLNCYVMCEHISKSNKADTKFEYLYTYKYPEETVPEGGYEAFSKSTKKENLGYNLEVTILGITKENPFFDVEPTDSKNEVVISSAMAEKFEISEGEVLVVEDEEAETHYAFTVKDIAQYSTSFYVFMDIDHMREMFGESDTYYNQVFSDRKLDIESGRLYAITTKKDIEKAADVFINEMTPMITMMTIFPILIFVVVMYLMMKVMIDRCAFHISMVKVFGYRPREIKKLYLNGNFYVIAIGAAICIPLAKKCMDIMYPMMVANVGCAMKLAFPWQMYAIIYAAVLLLYFIINEILVGRLKKVNLAEVLKNRE